MNIKKELLKIYTRIQNNSFITAQELCDLVGAKLPKELRPSDKFSSFVFENKNVLPNCLFVPFEDYSMSEALRDGAKAVLTDREISEKPCIKVDDLIDATNKIAKFIYKSKKQLPVVLVAGSEGKTTTKRFVYKVLSSKFNTFCQLENANSFTALTFWIQRINDTHEWFIYEADEKRSNNTKNISELLKPRFALITNMYDAHIGFLGGQEEVDKSIAGVELGMDNEGIVVINADDPETMKYQFKHKTMTVSVKDKSADCFASNITNSADGIEFDIHYKSEDTHILLRINGVHNVYNAMMAYIVGRESGISKEEIAQALGTYKSTGIRQNVWKQDGKVIYIDCFNASAQSIALTLKGFCDISPIERGGKKVAVLGDIAEIEGYEDRVYSTIAKSVDSSDVDILITYGKYSKAIGENVTRSNCEIIHTEDPNELVKKIKDVENRGATNFLFKASRIMKLENIVREAFTEIYEQNI